MLFLQSIIVFCPMAGLSLQTQNSPTLPLLYLHHSSFSNPSLALPTSQLILQPFRCFTYVTAHSLTLLSLLLCQRIFTCITWRAAHAVLHILHDILGYRKLAVRWIPVPHEFSEVQQWHCYTVAQALLDREGDDFLGRIVAMSETWARSYET